jgi:hypothetical protein
MGIILNDYCCTNDVWTFSLQNVSHIANVFCKNVLCSPNVLPPLGLFFKYCMCFVLTCAFLSQDKIALVWLKEKQCTQVISQWITQRVSSFSAVFIIYSCGGPAVARKRKKRKCKNPPDSGREPDVSVWLYMVKICSERRLYECSNRLTRQIFITKINIREEICYCITAYLNRVCKNSTHLNTYSHKEAVGAARATSFFHPRRQEPIKNVIKVL